MATISKTGIQDGSTSKAEHITRIIDALDGTATTEVVATGSFTGSFTGDGSALTGVGGGSGIFVQTGSYYATTNNLQITGSVILNGQVLTKGNGVTSLSGSRGVVLPATLLSNGEEVSQQLANLPYGGYVFVNLSGNSSVTLTLPTAADSFAGYEWNIGVSASGGGGDMTINGGASKISGNIAAASNPANFYQVSTLTIDSGNSRAGDTLSIRGMGSTGWLLTGTFRDGSSIS
jgi:hypothetical protein